MSKPFEDGDPNSPICIIGEAPSFMEMRAKVTSRFMGKVEKTDNCWEWKGQKGKKGYGLFSFYRRRYGAHRVAYELFKGKITEGLQIDHLCRNKGCVNPDHLEAVTPSENCRRAGNGLWLRQKYSNQTYCKNGHAYLPDNLIMDKNGYRRCRLCRLQQKRNNWPGYAARRKARAEGFLKLYEPRVAKKSKFSTPPSFIEKVENVAKVIAIHSSAEAVFARLCDKLIKVESGCWEWQGCCDGAGYGMITINGKSTRTHIAMFELCNGTRKKGFVLDHICENPKCANPIHLRYLTRHENMRRGKMHANTI